MWMVVSPHRVPLVQMDRKEVLEAIRRDYEVNNYFVSGQGDMASYEPDCEFSDPFVSFRGVERFKSNVSNLGAYLCATVAHAFPQCTHVISESVLKYNLLPLNPGIRCYCLEPGIRECLAPAPQKTMNCLPMWTKGPGPNAMPTLFQWVGACSPSKRNSFCPSAAGVSSARRCLLGCALQVKGQLKGTSGGHDHLVELQPGWCFSKGGMVANQAGSDIQTYPTGRTVCSPLAPQTPLRCWAFGNRYHRTPRADHLRLRPLPVNHGPSLEGVAA